MGISLWLPRSPLPNAQAPRWIPQPQVVADTAAGASASHPASQRSPQAAAELMREAFGAQGKSSPTEAIQAVATTTSTASALSESVATPPESQAPSSVSSAAASPSSLVSGTSGAADTGLQLPGQAPAADGGAEPKAGQASAAETVTPGPAVTPEFQLHFVKASERGLWVCDSGSDPEILQGFIQRVMAAWYESVVFMNKVPGFRWPFIASRNQDQSEPVALQALTAQWQVLRPQGSEGYTIALGEDAAHWLKRIGVTPQVCLPDLASLQSSAEAKRCLWLALQSIYTL